MGNVRGDRGPSSYMGAYAVLGYPDLRRRLGIPNNLPLHLSRECQYSFSRLARSYCNLPTRWTQRTLARLCWPNRDIGVSNEFCAVCTRSRADGACRVLVSPTLADTRNRSDNECGRSISYHARCCRFGQPVPTSARHVIDYSEPCDATAPGLRGFTNGQSTFPAR